jgi:hypothetical protein
MNSPGLGGALGVVLAEARAKPIPEGAQANKFVGLVRESRCLGTHRSVVLLGFLIIVLHGSLKLVHHQLRDSRTRGQADRTVPLVDELQRQAPAKSRVYVHRGRDDETESTP